MEDQFIDQFAQEKTILGKSFGDQIIDLEWKIDYTKRLISHLKAKDDLVGWRCLLVLTREEAGNQETLYQDQPFFMTAALDRVCNNDGKGSANTVPILKCLNNIMFLHEPARSWATHEHLDCIMTLTLQSYTCVLDDPDLFVFFRFLFLASSHPAVSSDPFYEKILAFMIEFYIVYGAEQCASCKSLMAAIDCLKTIFSLSSSLAIKLTDKR